MPENSPNTIREALGGTPVSGPAPTDPVDDTSVAVQTTASPDELWQSWLEMLPHVESAADRLNELGERWKTTTDPVIKEQLWVDYESAARTYRVLASWREVFYAAYIFATDGVVCADFAFGPPQSSAPPAPASGPPQF